MLPIVFDWHWTIDRILFMGLLYFALTVIGIGLITALFMTARDLRRGGGHDHAEPHAEAEH